MSNPSEWGLPERYAVVVTVFERGEARPVWGSTAGAETREGVRDFLVDAGTAARDDLLSETSNGGSTE